MLILFVIYSKIQINERNGAWEWVYDILSLYQSTIPRLITPRPVPLSLSLLKAHSLFGVWFQLFPPFDNCHMKTKPNIHCLSLSVSVSQRHQCPPLLSPSSDKDYLKDFFPSPLKELKRKKLHNSFILSLSLSLHVCETPNKNVSPSSFAVAHLSSGFLLLLLCFIRLCYSPRNPYLWSFSSTRSSSISR